MGARYVLWCARSPPGYVTQAPVLLQRPLELVQPQPLQGPAWNTEEGAQSTSPESHKSIAQILYACVILLNQYSLTIVLWYFVP